MSDLPANADQIILLTDAVCDDRVSEDGLAELDTLLLADGSARRCYLDYCRMHAALGLELRAQHAVEKLCRQIDVEPTAVAPPIAVTPLSVSCAPIHSAAATRVVSPLLPRIDTGVPDKVDYLSADWPLAYMTATVIMGLGLLIAAFVPVSHPVQFAASENRSASLRQDDAEESASDKGNEVLASSFPPMIGQITGMIGCEWSDPQTEAYNGASIPLGRRYALSSGLMQLTYDTGAKVILQGPCTYEVESRTGGYLSIGKLTAKIAKKPEARSQKSEVSNQKSPDLCPLTSDLFAVRTPTAIVTDLGTEFGVEVDATGTRSCVFRGEVKVVGRRSGGRGNTEVNLRENQSIEVDRTGAVVPRKTVDTGQFIRSMPSRLSPYFPKLFGGAVIFEEHFDTDSTNPAQDYPSLTFDLCEQDGENSKASGAVVCGGVLQLHRRSLVRTGDVVMTSKTFSGRMLVSVDIGNEAKEVNWVGVALRLGHLGFFIVPGGVYGPNFGGTFYVDREADDPNRRNLAMQFTPDVKVLHHLFVYYDGQETFEVRVVDGINPSLFFCTTVRDASLRDTEFRIGVECKGKASTGLFDNLRVVQLPEARGNAASTKSSPLKTEAKDPAPADGNGDASERKPNDRNDEKEI